MGLTQSDTSMLSLRMLTIRSIVVVVVDDVPLVVVRCDPFKKNFSGNRC